MVTTELTTRLEGFRNRNSKNPNYINNDIYRMFYKSELYIIAYNNIKSNDGAETEGSDGTSLHGFSQTWIDDIIESMRNESYQPNPARTTYIPKRDGSGKMRKLAFPNGVDKLIQECVRIVLDCIYEPTFSNMSHGYRPNRSIQSATAQVSRWTGTTWFIEGDIASCFDEVDHRVLESILRERIADERFIRLINKLLKAGYFDTELEFHETKQSVNQGSICSPILANIYLDKLDRFMEEVSNRDTKGTSRKTNPEYARTWYQRRKAEEAGDVTTIKSLSKKLKDLPSKDAMDNNFRRVKYVRYADDFLVGIIGNKAHAQQIKQEIAEFLKEVLKLRLSDNKTKITNVLHSETKFLGYRITKGKKYGRIKILMDTEKIIRRLHEKGFCTKQGYPIGITKFFNLPIQDIVKKGNDVLRGLLYNNQGCNNYYQAWRIQYIVQFAIAKTIARKYDISMKKVFKQYGKRLTVTYLNPKGQVKERSLALFRSFALNREFFKNWNIKLKEHVKITYDTRNPLKRLCYICESSQNRKMFHRRKKSLIEKPYSLIVTVMIRINRRQICLCEKCFTQVTNNELECNQISAAFSG